MSIAKGRTTASISARHEEKMDFPPEVVSQLGVYVYRLIDPRNGETFYVGKGRGNRVFAHARAQIDDEDVDEKLNRIREIRLSGLAVGHIIHRHGMDDRTAFEVEAALIDAYPGLTNALMGVGGGDVGVMHASEIIEKYQAQTAVFNHRVLLINVNQTSEDRSLYEAVRFAWKLNPRKAEEADVVAAVRRGIIVGVFEADRWVEATAGNFPGREPVPGRFGFVGQEAGVEFREQYLRKRLPDDFQKRGAANPIRYTWT